MKKFLMCCLAIASLPLFADPLPNITSPTTADLATPDACHNYMMNVAKILMQDNSNPSISHGNAFIYLAASSTIRSLDHGAMNVGGVDWEFSDSAGGLNGFKAESAFCSLAGQNNPAIEKVLSDYASKNAAIASANTSYAASFPYTGFYCKMTNNHCSDDFSNWTFFTGSIPLPN